MRPLNHSCAQFKVNSEPNPDLCTERPRIEPTDQLSVSFITAVVDMNSWAEVLPPGAGIEPLNLLAGRASVSPAVLLFWCRGQRCTPVL